MSPTCISVGNKLRHSRVLILRPSHSSDARTLGIQGPSGLARCFGSSGFFSTQFACATPVRRLREPYRCLVSTLSDGFGLAHHPGLPRLLATIKHWWHKISMAAALQRQVSTWASILTLSRMHGYSSSPQSTLAMIRARWLLVQCVSAWERVMAHSLDIRQDDPPAYVSDSTFPSTSP